MSQNDQSTLTGALFVGGERITTDDTFAGVNAADGSALPTSFSIAGNRQIGTACSAAQDAFLQMRAIPYDQRATLLETIADSLLSLGDSLLQRAHLETALPLPRLTGERARTIAQLRLFASELRSGGWLRIRIDPAQPERTPLPRADLRMQMVPLGPVAVFGASNFPLAFSVAGGDTASALAAGCPVVVKGHPAHPGTSELTATAVAHAVRSCGFPEGTFSLLNGPGNELGSTLVADPRIKAVGFTGSRGGGQALMKIAAARPVPIPVYAEMSSINPVLLFPNALAARSEDLARGYVSSLSMGAGQFCTNPGIVVAVESSELDRFIEAAAQALSSTTAEPMLTPQIFEAYRQGTARLESLETVSSVARGRDGGMHCGAAAIFSMSAESFLADETAAQEIFGAASLIVRCRSAKEMATIVRHLEGQLTATVHFEPADEAAVAQVVPALESLAGRLIANGWPTGVEVGHAMVHGGPYPATSDGRSTSVGTLAIERFLRPVSYQDFPDNLLPEVLRRGAQEEIPHRLDGQFRAPSVIENTK